MSWMDIGIGNCVACGDERRRFVKVDGAHGSSAIALCCPCTMRVALTGMSLALMSPSEARKHITQAATRRREHRNYVAERRKRLAAEGLCVDCGKEPALPTCRRGEICNKRHRAYDQRRNEKTGAVTYRPRRWL